MQDYNRILEVDYDATEEVIQSSYIYLPLVSTCLPELMVNFVTSSYKPELLSPIVKKIARIPEVVSIVNNVNTSVGNTSVGEEEYKLYGKSTITEILRGITFQISAHSFFQTNTYQAKILYKLIEDFTNLKRDGSEVVFNLFCGKGTIRLILAKRVRHGMYMAMYTCCNAELNGISNATFVEEDLNEIDENFGNDFPKSYIVISVNDLFVMKAWTKTYPDSKHVKFLANGPRTYTKALGLELDLLDKGLGIRSRRFALLLGDFKAKDVNVEFGKEFTVSGVEKNSQKSLNHLIN